MMLFSLPGELQLEIVKKRFLDAQAQLKDEKDPQKIQNVISNIWADSQEEYFRTVATMSDEEYQKLLAEIDKRLNDTNIEIRNFWIRRLSEIPDSSYDQILPAMSPLLSLSGMKKLSVDIVNSIIEDNPKILKRLFQLEYENAITLQSERIAELSRNETWRELEAIASSRFGSDLNWVKAVCTLAVIENLVKKKIVELDSSREAELHEDKRDFFQWVAELEKMLRARGNDISLSFAMTASLRRVRNKLEHTGFMYRVTHQEAHELLSLVTRFDKELFESGD
jgi:hypothetical protein